MGTNLNCLNNYETNDYFRSVHVLCKLLMERVFNPLKHFDIIYRMCPDFNEELKCVKTLHQFSHSVIAKRQAARKNKIEEKGSNNEDEDDIVIEKKRVCFLDILLDSSIDGKSMTIEEIREEVDTFMFAVSFFFNIYT